MSDAQTYGLIGYGQMIADSPRMNAYFQALQLAIRQGSIVVDVGAGTGIFSLLACKLGASRVYAVEPAEAIEVARECAAANGYTNIVFVRAMSTAVELDRKADVIVADVRGVLPFFQNSIATLMDARDRLLAPGGVLIPLRDTVWVAPADARELYAPCDKPWSDQRFGVDITPARRYITNTWRKVRAQASHIICAPQRFAELDYGHARLNANVENTVSWDVNRARTLHGLLMWFDSSLTGTVGFSNAPGAPEMIYGQAFFPLDRPVELLAGDRVTAAISARLVAGDYVWTWTVSVDRDDITVQAHRQSSFFSSPMSQELLAECDPEQTPEVTQEIELDRFCLALIDGKTSIEEIAGRLQHAFPARMTPATARHRVIDLARRYRPNVGFRFL